MIRVATIGTSLITYRFAAAVAELPGVELACVVSRDPARAAAVATEVGARTSSADLDAVLASSDIDAVYVASPNTVHHAQALAALRAGKHVLVEKPAVPTGAEWEELTAQAAASGVVLLEAIRNLYDPGFALIEATLPRLGTIRRVSFRFHQRSARYDRVLAGERLNIFDPGMAGGSLYDLGVYCIQPLVGLFGAPASVHARLVQVAGGADGAGAAHAAYDDFVADLSFSKITLSDTPSTIEGEAGTLVIDHLDDPRLLVLQTVNGESEEFHVAKRGDDKLANMIEGVERFAAAVRGEVDVAPDQRRSLLAARLLDEIRRSAGVRPRLDS